MAINYFGCKEFDSPDKPGSGTNMDEEHIDMLNFARALNNIPYIITSGYRTLEYSKEKGYSITSSHTKGLASDILVRNSQERWLILDALKQAGFKRIGIGNGFIHCDNDKDKPQNVIWTYY
jgi:uncharacterized protein YcbK (DUF882 family)